MISQSRLAVPFALTAVLCGIASMILILDYRRTREGIAAQGAALGILITIGLVFLAAAN